MEAEGGEEGMGPNLERNSAIGIVSKGSISWAGLAFTL